MMYLKKWMAKGVETDGLAQGVLSWDPWLFVTSGGSVIYWELYFT